MKKNIDFKKKLLIFIYIILSSNNTDCSDKYTLDTALSIQVRDVYEVPSLQHICRKKIHKDFFIKVDQAFAIAKKINPTEVDIAHLDTILDYNDEVQKNPYITNNITLPSLLHLRNRYDKYTLIDCFMGSDNAQGLKVALDHGFDMYTFMHDSNFFDPEHNSTLIQRCFNLDRISIHCLRLLLCHEQEITPCLKKHHNKLTLINTGDKGTAPLLYLFNNEFSDRLKFKHEEAISLLIAAGAHVDSVNKNGTSLVEIAINNRMDDIARLLIIHGADVHIPIYNGHQTLLQLAAMKKINNIIEPLINAGSNINQFDNKKCTALHYACKNNNQEAALILFNHGADIHLADNNGDTALHYAAKDNKHAIAGWLLSVGADVSQVNNDGKSPLVYAKKHKAKKVIPLLIAAQQQAAVNQSNSMPEVINNDEHISKHQKID